MKKWMQKVSKKINKNGTGGSLRKYIAKKYGSKGFTKHDTIKLDVLRKEMKSNRLSIKRKAVLAYNFRRLSRRRSFGRPLTEDQKKRRRENERERCKNMTGEKREKFLLAKRNQYKKRRAAEALLELGTPRIHKQPKTYFKTEW